MIELMIFCALTCAFTLAIVYRDKLGAWWKLIAGACLAVVGCMLGRRVEDTPPEREERRRYESDQLDDITGDDRRRPDLSDDDLADKLKDRFGG